jgi:hypothetical protein
MKEPTLLPNHRHCVNVITFYFLSISVFENTSRNATACRAASPHMKYSASFPVGCPFYQMNLNHYMGIRGLWVEILLKHG